MAGGLVRGAGVHQGQRDHKLLRALRGHLRVLEETHELGPGEAVPLLRALLTEKLSEARAAGLSEEALASLASEGEALSSPGPTPAAASSSYDPNWPLPGEEASALAPGLASAPVVDLRSSSSSSAELFELSGLTNLDEEQPSSGAPDPFALLKGATPGTMAPPGRSVDPASTPDDTDVLELVEPLEDGGEEIADQVVVGVELIAEPEQTGDSEVDGGTVRRSPRINTRLEVLVEMDNLVGGFQGWTRDISSSGLFIELEEPPPLGSVLHLTLQVPGDNTIGFIGQVAKVVEPTVATAAGDAPGVGIKILEITAEEREKLDQLLLGVAEQLEQQAVSGGSGVEEGPVGRIRSFLHFINTSKLYEALGVAPDASDDEIRVAIEELTASVAPGTESAAAFPLEDLRAVVRGLERGSSILTAPARRLAYDFVHGYVRAEERIAARRAQGDSIDDLRAVWHKVFPEKLEQAKELIRRAVPRARRYDYVEACLLGHEAYELDPFNSQLGGQLESWETYRVIAREIGEGSIDVEARTAWAAERGVAAPLLRALWRSLQPERFERGLEEAKLAMEAERDGHLDQAIVHATEALAEDPFNTTLREAIERMQGAG